MTDLEPYQLEAAAFLAGRKHALLADEMGVGKTASAIRACDLVGARRILVLVPASARVNWLDEFAKFSPMDRPAAALMTAKDAIAGVTVCSYDLVAASDKLRKKLLAVEWDVLILDEAHYMKNRTARRTRAVYGRKCDCTENALAGKARFIWRLTGTPVPNYADELWTHLHSAGLYAKNWYEFVAEFCTGYTSDYGFKITGNKNVERLKGLLAGFMLRRKKEDVMELPELTFSTHTLTPNPEDAQAIADATAELDVSGSDDELLGRMAKRVTNSAALRRIVGEALVGPYLQRLTCELTSDPTCKFVVFAHHRLALEMLHAGLRNAVLLDGSTTPRARHAAIMKFQTDPACRVFIGQLTAAGTAINLTAASHVDLLEQSWVPADNAQAIARIHRKGQGKPCHVRFFGIAGGIHQRITEALARKTAEQFKLGL